MNLEDYRTLFIVATLGLILVAVTPTLSMVVPIRSGSERFSELWLLGLNHTAEGYPFNVGVGKKYNVTVGVGNHMGCSEYYMVYVKFCNQTQELPNPTTSEPSPLNSTYEFRFFLSDGKVWETPLTFAIGGNSSLVQSISINGMVFPVNCTSTWDSNRNGFYYQLFFELWLYNVTSRTFQFHNRFVRIWLNVTV